MNDIVSLDGSIQQGQDILDQNNPQIHNHSGSDQPLIDELQVTSLKANSIDAGTITGSTITGGIIQTSLSNPRIVLDSNINAFSYYDPSGIERLHVGSYLAGVPSIVFRDAANNLAGSMTGTQVSAVSFMTLDGAVQVTNSLRLNGLGNSQGNQLWIYTDDGTTAHSIIGYSGTQFSITDNTLFDNGIVSSGDVLPFADNAQNLGSASFRWKLVRGVTITPGDLAWEETACHICGVDFLEGDKLTMVVKKMSDEHGDLLTYTVPICKKCFLEV